MSTTSEEFCLISLAAWMSFCLWLTCAFGALTPSLPTIDQAYPQSATVGEPVDMELEGNYLDSVQSIQSPRE